MVDDLSDFSKGQAFECFHSYKQAHISLCAYCAYVYSLFLLPFLFVVYCLFVFLFLLLTTILVNKDVYKTLNAPNSNLLLRIGIKMSVVLYLKCYCNAYPNLSQIAKVHLKH